MLFRNEELFVISRKDLSVYLTVLYIPAPAIAPRTGAIM